MNKYNVQRLHNRFIGMSYLFYIALFGVLVVFFLWLRDMRIFVRTGLPGFRRAAYRGVLYTALSIFGAGLIAIYPGIDIMGTGIMLLGLFLQGKEEREKIWTNEPTSDRLLGTAPQR